VAIVQDEHWAGMKERRFASADDNAQPDAVEVNCFTDHVLRVSAAGVSGSGGHAIGSNVQTPTTSGMRLYSAITASPCSWQTYGPCANMPLTYSMCVASFVQRMVTGELSLCTQWEQRRRLGVGIVFTIQHAHSLSAKRLQPAPAKSVCDSSIAADNHADIGRLNA